MKLKPSSLLCLTLAVQTITQADTVLTTDGARLTGSITLIDAGVIHLQTSYAGTLKIQQDQVASFETDEPVFVRLASGTTMSGPVKSSGPGKLKIQSEDGILETDTTRVVASWSPTAEDPAIVALRKEEESMRRKWKFRGAFDLLGKDGNTEEFSLGIAFDAKLVSPNDELAFFGEYEQREKNGDQTEDRIRGGSSYESFYNEHYGWYVRTELEQDKIDEIDLRSTSGAGLSFRLINKENQKLVARTGLGYRNTSYSNDKENESSATLDFGIAHEYKFKQFFSMENDLTYVPSIDDFGNYRVVHDSGIVIPLGTGERWKIRMGVKNEYESQPAAAEKLDTTYYSKMIYSWD
ncbi:MAG TPA: hypothetical protein DCX06_05885 [Opitutae bacterium]|nr:hypothetical protein [Opitutae bacterium]